MSGIKQITPPFEVYPVPWLARKTAPVGPALPVVTGKNLILQISNKYKIDRLR